MKAICKVNKIPPDGAGHLRQRNRLADRSCVIAPGVSGRNYATPRDLALFGLLAADLLLPFAFVVFSSKPVSRTGGTPDATRDQKASRLYSSPGKLSRQNTACSTTMAAPAAKASRGRGLS